MMPRGTAISPGREKKRGKKPRRHHGNGTPREGRRCISSIARRKGKGAWSSESTTSTFFSGRGEKGRQISFSIKKGRENLRRRQRRSGVLNRWGGKEGLACSTLWKRKLAFYQHQRSTSKERNQKRGGRPDIFSSYPGRKKKGK